jgi:hypothetical protein
MAIIPHVVKTHNTIQHKSRKNFGKKIKPVKALGPISYSATVKLPSEYLHYYKRRGDCQYSGETGKERENRKRT